MLPDPGALVRFSRWITPEQVRSASTRTSSSSPHPRTPPRSRRQRMRRPRLVHPARRDRGARARGDHARVPDDQDARAARRLRRCRRDPRVGSRARGAGAAPGHPGGRDRADRVAGRRGTRRDRRRHGAHRRHRPRAAARARGDPIVRASSAWRAASSTPPRWGWRRPSTAGRRARPRRRGALAAEADVLVHLAFIILGGREETRAINLEGSRNVFEAAGGVSGSSTRRRSPPTASTPTTRSR